MLLLKNIIFNKVMTEIIAIISTLFTLVVGTGGILFYKQSKRLKAAEVAAAEKDVLKLDLENQKSTNDEWIRLYEETKEALEKAQSKVNELNTKLQKATEIEGQQRLVINDLTWSRCIVNGCAKRTPPRNFEMKLEQIENLHDYITRNIENYKTGIDFDDEENLDE